MAICRSLKKSVTCLFMKDLALSGAKVNGRTWFVHQPFHHHGLDDHVAILDLTGFILGVDEQGVHHLVLRGHVHHEEKLQFQVLSWNMPFSHVQTNLFPCSRKRSSSGRRYLTRTLATTLGFFTDVTFEALTHLHLPKWKLSVKKHPGQIPG